MITYNDNQITCLPQTGYIRLPTVLAFIPIGKTTWWEGVKSGRFPQPVKLGPRTTAWRVDDIRRFIDNPTHFATKEMPSL